MKRKGKCTTGNVEFAFVSQGPFYSFFSLKIKQDVMSYSRSNASVRDCYTRKVCTLPICFCFFQRRRRIFLNLKMAEEIADHFYIVLFTYKRVSVNPKYVRCMPIKT